MEWLSGIGTVLTIIGAMFLVGRYTYYIHKQWRYLCGATRQLESQQREIIQYLYRLERKLKKFERLEQVFCNEQLITGLEVS